MKILGGWNFQYILGVPKNSSVDYIFRKRLFAGGPPANKKLFAGGPPANKKLFAGGPPENKKLFAGGLPANKKLFAEVLRKIRS